MGNLILNEYKTGKVADNEYCKFVESVFTQIVKAMPKPKSTLKLKSVSYEKTEDTMLADLIDRIEDSVKDFYEDYRQALFNEMLADKIADRNYPVIGVNESDAFKNLIAKNIYFET